MTLHYPLQKQTKKLPESWRNSYAAGIYQYFSTSTTLLRSGENDILDHFVNLYARKALYCVLLLSRHYPLHSWTEAERTSARELALRDADEYILPIQLDDSEIPGITEAKGYRDLRKDPIESIVTLLEEKLSEAKARSGPPSQSHDLRSGNVPNEKI